MSDKELIQDIIAGNSSAFKGLMEKYQLQVFRVVVGFLHSKEDAEDVTQEIFVKVYQWLHKFRGDSEFSTWLYRIAVNMSLNYIRRNQKNTLLQSLEDVFYKISGDKTPLDELEESERDQRIKKAIDSLPEKQRTAFVLSKYEELPQKRIAAIMNTTEGAVEQLLQRAKTNLQKKLKPKGQG